jgi:cytolysin (calcineurin-like family phosphatase)
MTEDPIWLDWLEPEVAHLTDRELLSYVDEWHDRGEEYRNARAQVSKEHPDAYNWGYSGWWCGKQESIGLREQQRRRIRRQRGI